MNKMMHLVMGALFGGKVFVVPRVGIEPTLLSEPDFESGASTNFTTEACRRQAGVRGGLSLI